MVKKIAFCLLMLTCVSQAQDEPAKIGDVAPDFSLKDRYDNEVSLTSLLKDKLIVVIYTDKPSTKYSRVYLDSLNTRYNSERYSNGVMLEKIKIQKIANLMGSPNIGFVRSLIMRMFKGQEPRSLLDWDGIIAHKYGFQGGRTNIYIIDSAGVLRYRGTGKASEEELESIYVVIDRLLEKSEE